MSAPNDHQKKSVTILAVPEGRATLHRWHLPAWVLNRKFHLGTLIGFSILVLHYFVSVYLSALVPGLLSENKALRDQVAELQVKTGAMSAELERMNMLDHRVRHILGIEQQQDAPTVGVGGPLVPSKQEELDLNPADAKRLTQLDAEVESLSSQMHVQQQRFEGLLNYFSEQRSQLASTPSIWPVRGWVTSGFGNRTDPFTGQYRMHEGLDITANIGAPVVAPADGIVIFAGARGGYGKIISIDHGYGVMTSYGHLSEIHVREGQRVSRSEVIGGVGSTGRSTGPHVHYEVSVNGVPVDPAKFILN